MKLDDLKNVDDLTQKQLADIWDDVAFWKDVRQKVKQVTINLNHDGLLYSQGCTDDLTSD